MMQPPTTRITEVAHLCGHYKKETGRVLEDGTIAWEGDILYCPYCAALLPRHIRDLQWWIELDKINIEVTQEASCKPQT